MLIRSGLGVSFGIVFSVLLFKRRAWPAWVGLGFGAGRAWEECDNVSTSSNEIRIEDYHALMFYLVIQASIRALNRRPPYRQAISHVHHPMRASKELSVSFEIGMQLVRCIVVGHGIDR